MQHPPPPKKGAAGRLDAQIQFCESGEGAGGRGEEAKQLVAKKQVGRTEAPFFEQEGKGTEDFSSRL